MFLTILAYLASGFNEWRWECAHLTAGVECYLSFVHIHLSSARRVPLSKLNLHLNCFTILVSIYYSFNYLSITLTIAPDRSNIILGGSSSKESPAVFHARGTVRQEPHTLLLTWRQGGQGLGCGGGGNMFQNNTEQGISHL